RRFFIVLTWTVNFPRRLSAHLCVRPRKSKVSGCVPAGSRSPGLVARTPRDASFPDEGSVRTLRTSWEALAGPSRRPPDIESRARRHQRSGLQTLYRGGEASPHAQTIRRAQNEGTRWPATG